MPTIPMLNRCSLCVLAFVLALVPACLAQPQLYVNGNIYTLDPENPRADTMLIENGLIASIGSRDAVRTEMRSQGFRVYEEVDLKGRTVIPGLIDAHGHIAGLGQARLW